MFESRLLPAEGGPRVSASVEEASPSVHSIRQRFEAAATAEQDEVLPSPQKLATNRLHQPVHSNTKSQPRDQNIPPDRDYSSRTKTPKKHHHTRRIQTSTSAKQLVTPHSASSPSLSLVSDVSSSNPSSTASSSSVPSIPGLQASKPAKALQNPASVPDTDSRPPRKERPPYVRRSKSFAKFEKSSNATFDQDPYASSTKNELARFLQSKGSATKPAGFHSEPETSTRDFMTPSTKTGTSVSSLIEQFSGGLTNREPLSERDLQRIADLPSRSRLSPDIDTFCDTRQILDVRHPKTDPGQLESFKREHQIHRTQSFLHYAAISPATGDQDLRNMISRGKGALEAAAAASSAALRAFPDQGESNPSGEGDVVSTSVVAVSVVSRSSVSAEVTKGVGGSDSRDVGNTYPTNHEAAISETASANRSDWGAAHVHLQELFIEAETTAEKAVQCDENEEYYDAFSLYCNVVALYYKVIPFLNAEEGEDVNQRIKMYTRRCEAIREAFENDDIGADDEIQVDLADVGFENGFNNSNRANYDDTRFGERQNFQESGPSEYMPNQSSNSASARTARELLDLEEFNGIPNDKHSLIPTVGSSSGGPRQIPRDREVDNGVAALHGTAARGGHGAFFAPNSSVAAAHWNRLSRPISRRSVREAATTNSVSREKVAEMQERVQVMQTCLNNFTVKRKHLGPARALELQITTLNANTFGDLKRLEPLPPKLEHMWATELEVLLSMLQEIKESRPGQPNALRDDIARHLPALQRCDRIVRNTLRSFGELIGHVDYVERETGEGAKGGDRSQRRWWIKVPVVKRGGLPSNVRTMVEDAEQEMKGVFKVCHEINVDVVKSMPVPTSFVEGLPKHARSLISKDLKEGLTTWGMFKVSDFMKDRGIWNREAAKDITSSLEKVALIWEAKTSQKSFISRTFDIRGERFHQAVTAFRRCQNAIRDLRRDWPTMTHTDLDMAKIQSNGDIGLAGLEAYSRALESRAARLLTRIKELLDADDEARGALNAFRGKSSTKELGSNRAKGRPPARQK